MFFVLKHLDSFSSKECCKEIIRCVCKYQLLILEWTWKQHWVTFSVPQIPESTVFLKKCNMKGGWKSGSVANKMYKYKCPILLFFGIMFLGRFKEYCTCSRQLFVYSFIILIYPALLLLEKKFRKNTNKCHENSHFYDTNTEKRTDTLKVLEGLRNARMKLQRPWGRYSGALMVWADFQLGLSSVPPRSIPAPPKRGSVITLSAEWTELSSACWNED